MRRFITILSVVSTILTIGLTNHSWAAGETGHSDLMRLLSAIYGLNITASDYLATVNQSVDKVPLSAATQSGRASAKLHFATTVTESDLDEKELEKLLKNNGKRTLGQVMAMFFKNNAMGGGVASLGNAEAAEALGKAMKKGDGVLFGMGLHYLLDTAAPFHDGYLGALTNPIPVIKRIPFLHQFAFGHLADGTSPDRLSIGKIIMAMDAMGPFLITLRETQKNEIGVNTKWLETLKSQGVDVNDSESIRNWFLNQSVVKEILQQKIPANQSVDYAKVIISELKEHLIQLQFFNDEIYLNQQLDKLLVKVSHLKTISGTKVSLNDLITEMIDNAWTDGKLNEKQVIKETVTDYFSKESETEKLSDLIYDSQYETMPDYAQDALREQLAQKNTHAPHTREWIIDQIRAKITRGMISQSWEKFNTAYLNETTESAQIKIEQEALGKIEKYFFNRTGKYSFNPGADHWDKVFSTWRSLSKEERGKTMLEKIITFCDLVIRTKAYEGKEIHTLSFGLKATIFFKTMGFIWKEEFVNPRTSSGNFAVRVKAFRKRIIAEMQREFPEGMLTEKMLEKAQKYNDYINRKFNSDQAVGVRQKTASAVRASAKFLQNISGSSKRLSVGGGLCEALFN